MRSISRNHRSLFLTGTEQDDVLEGATARDVLVGLGGNDQLFGLGGDDTLSGGLGDDLLDGGEGFDTVSYADSGRGVYVDLGLAEAQDTLGLGIDTLVSIEAVVGSPFNDYLFAGDTGGQLSGAAGDDALYGGDGADRISGGWDDDVISGKQGDDILSGDSGWDTVSYVAAPTGIWLSLLRGIAQDGYGSRDRIDGFEYVIGSHQADTIIGSLADDEVQAAPGDDHVSGRSGSDEIRGSDGNDFLGGGGGSDDLSGDAGDDTLAGGQGKDFLYGGDGADTFVYRKVTDSTTALYDVISFFSHTEGDRIDLSQIDASVALPGDQAFVFIGDLAFTHVAGELRVTHDADHAYVEGDVDGDGAADLYILLSGETPIISDFVL